MIKQGTTIKLLKLKPKTVITISVFIFIVMAVSAYFEVVQNKKEIFHLLSQNASSLVETITLSSHNTLNSSYEIEDVMAERLLDNARLIKNIDSLKKMNDQDLIKLSRENNLYKIVLFDKKGKCECAKYLTAVIGDSLQAKESLLNQLEPILSGSETEMVLGMQKSKELDEQRYAVAVARSFNRGAIVIYLDADDFLNFRKKIGIGRLIQEINKNQGIEYIVLQDTIGILAAGKSVDSINTVAGDPFLTGAFYSDTLKMRLFDYNGHDVFEVVKRLYHDNEVVGVFRIGLGLDELREVEARTTSRIIIFSIVLGLFSVIVLSIIFTSQNLKLITGEFSRFKSFTGSILENLGEAVVVINKENRIVLFNKFAELLFAVDSGQVMGQSVQLVFPDSVSEIFDAVNAQGFTTGDFELQCEINNQLMHLVFNVTRNYDDEKNPDGFTFVIKDLTEKKRLEELSMRNEKLSAMGELASGVAHEIRNPINSIGMIAQRLFKEFNPDADKEDYFNILTVLKNEVARVNKIVTQFLNYSKPLELKLNEVCFYDFITKILEIFISHAKTKNIKIALLSDEKIKLRLDEELMTQAFLNLLQNSFDAVNDGGTIDVDYKVSEGYLCINIADNGIGIAEEKQHKIFNLYYTSKKDGNGLGLSITQKIVTRHNGEISFKSKENTGSTFTIKIPTV